MSHVNCFKVPHRIEISHKTIIFTVLFIISLWILYQVRDLIFLFLVSFVVMAGLRPFVDRLERLKIPRAFAILFIYVALFVLIGLAFSLIIQPLAEQSERLLREIGRYISAVLPSVNFTPEQITQQIPPLLQNVFKITSGVFSSLVGFFTFIVFTFYFLLERRHLKHFLKNFVGLEAEEKIARVFRQVEEKLGSWVVGQVTLMVIIGVSTYIGLRLLDVEFALPLAIIAGLLEIVPILGPVISAIPSVLVALTVSPILAIAVVALYFIIQQIENNIVVPFVMRKAVGLPPLVTIVAIMVGGKLAGIGGVILSVPLLVSLQVVIRELLLELDKGHSSNQGSL